MLTGECFLWVKTEWRFHFSLGVGAVLVSLGWALYFHEPMVFARSGALMTVAGVFMTYRGYFRRIDDPYARDNGEADRRAFSRWHRIKSKEEAKLEDRKAFRYGLISIMIGTLIWAYGDCLFSHWPNKIAVKPAVGAGRSAVAVHVASRRWLSYVRQQHTTQR
jgi:hypothetical protein